MMDARNMLSGAVAKLRLVMSDKGGKRMAPLVAGGVSLLLMLWWVIPLL